MTNYNERPRVRICGFFLAVSIFSCHQPNDDKLHRSLLLSALATSMHEPSTLLNMHGVKARGRYAFNNTVHIPLYTLKLN